MIVPPYIQRKFDYDELYVRHIGKIVKDTISNFCDENGFASIHRIKKLESLSEKLESGRFRKWSDIDECLPVRLLFQHLIMKITLLNFWNMHFLVVYVT